MMFDGKCLPGVRRADERSDRETLEINRTKGSRESLTGRVAELVLRLRIRVDLRLRALHVSGALPRDLNKQISP